MRTPRGRSFLSALVYAAVVVLLLLFALFARGFSRDIGDGRVSGRYSAYPLFQSEVPEDLTLTWNGLSLHFSHSTTPRLKGYDPAEDKSADLVFDGGARLRISPGSDTGGSLTFSSVGGGRSATKLVVPFSVAGAFQDPPSGSTVAWKRAGRTYLLTLPPGAQADAAARTLTLPIGGPAWSGVMRVDGIAAAARAPGLPERAQSRLPDQSAMPSEDGMQAALATYADAAYLGWSLSRYRAETGEWQLPDGSAIFSEDIGVGLLAESITRGTWPQMLPVWSKAMAQSKVPQAALSLATSCYVGGMKDFSKAQRERNAQRVATARDLLEKSDNQLLLMRGAVALLAVHGSPELVEKMGAFLAGRAPASLDVTSAAGLAEALMDFSQLVRQDETGTRLLRDAVLRRILPAVRATNAGVFLETDPRRSDLSTSIWCGLLLTRAGPLIASALAESIGRGLVTSGISLSDEKGFLPAAVVLSGGRVSAREGSLAPESIYPILPVARFVPRETPLVRPLGPGSWAWTSASITSVRGSGPGLVLEFSYPAGVPYHLMVQGLPPFTQLKLHGIPWRADQTYFKYSDGWAYDAGTRTLFMKITGKAGRETIDITY